MAASDLRRLMYLMGSAVTERRFRQLHLSGLFQVVRSTVAEAHAAVASHGSIWGYNEPIRSACGELVEVLEAVLRRHLVRGTSFAANLAFRLAVARMLSMLLAEIVEEGAFELMDGRRSSDRAIPRFRLFRPTTPCPQPDRAMVGRSDSVEKMVGVLLREDGGPPSLSVVPIVGAPGIGKTRFAQALFCDARVTEHFDMLFWVYVSQHFNPIQILTKILQLFLQHAHGGRRGEEVEAVAGKCSWLFDPEQLCTQEEDKQVTLQKLVHQALLGTRYLIVLDDVWNESMSEWSILMAALPSDTKGRVVVTTRIPAVASLMASIKPTTRPYFLHPLQKEFVLSFVHQWTHSFPADVTEIGMKIADKCDGVPLLLEYATSFLRERPIKLLWQQYLDFFDMLPDGDAILECAFASFYHLPSVLQKCLLHCSVFPMDYNFYAEELASHLAAEGFLPCAMTDAQRGDLLHKLLSECFYKVKDPTQKGRYTYKMYKILHAFARRIDTQDSPGRSAQVRAGAMHSIPIRYTTILVQPQTASFPSWLFELKELRTLVLLQEENMSLSDEQCQIKDIPEVFCRSLRHLRALSLEATKIRMIPRNFELLSYLRYLNLSHTDIRTIPSTISKLIFLRSLILSHCKKLVKLHGNTTKLVWLQELDLEGCQYLVELPGNISNVTSLIYLNVCQCLSLKQMPCRVGRLTNLKTLLGYVFSNNEGRAISELRSLINLNLLILESLENIVDLGEARDAQLQEKLKLQALTLRWKMHIEGTNYSKVLESLQPNPGLERLEIIAYQGEELPPWISSELYLNCLIEIRLINLKACKSLPPLGLLPLLKNVEISGAEAISSVDKGFCGNNGTFPSLEKLTFSYMINLEVWKQPSYAGAFPRLAQVTIIQCPKLALDLELPAVEKLTLWMNNTVLYNSKGGLRGLARSLKHAMVSFCEEMVTSSDCQGLQDIFGVQIMEICGCHEMKCLPEVMQHFSSLRRLAIDSCSKLEMLPNWLEDLPSLHLLRLSGCPMLRSIPQVLSEHHRTIICVDSCPNLSLPSSGNFVLTQDKGKEIMKDEEDLQSIIDEDED